MSLLNFPSEVTLQVMKKLNLFNRINLSMAHTSLLTLCFDESLDRKSTKTLLLDELRQLHQQSRTEEERYLCFSPDILDRLRIKNFNEVVRLYMNREHEKFVSNDKILHSLNGKVVLEGENEPFGDEFVHQFSNLIDRIEGDLLLAFVDVESLGNWNAKDCAEIISQKMRRGQKVYCVDFCKSIQWRLSYARDIKRNTEELFTVGYDSHLCGGSVYMRGGTVRRHWLEFNDKTNSASNINALIDETNDKTNNVSNINALIDMINEDSLILEVKQYLERLLLLEHLFPIDFEQPSIVLNTSGYF